MSDEQTQNQVLRARLAELKERVIVASDDLAKLRLLLDILLSELQREKKPTPICRRLNEYPHFRRAGAAFRSVAVLRCSRPGQ